MEEVKEKKTGKKIIIFLVIAFLIGYLFGQFSSPSQKKEISLTNAFIKLQLFDKSVDYNLFSDVLETINSKYFKQPISEKNLFYGAIKGMVAGLKDPYSVFFEPEEASKLKTELAGSFEGIGAEITSRKNIIVIVAPLEGTPAEHAGLKPNDEVYSIDGVDALGMTSDEAVSKIRGKKGTEVKLLIMRKGWEKPKEIVVKRDVINLITVTSEIKNDKIAYLRISYFNDKTTAEFNKAARKVLAASPKAIILDLRNNPGGYLYSAVEVAGLWTGGKTVVYEKSRNGEEKEHVADVEAKFADLPTIVLVNEGSASGSEILAGALQDYGLAKLLGTKTFGKGTVQELIEFADGSMVKVTVAQWLTPKKRVIEEKGIEPDIKVELSEKNIEEEKDVQLEKAIEILTSKP